MKKGKQVEYLLIWSWPAIKSFRMRRPLDNRWAGPLAWICVPPRFPTAVHRWRVGCRTASALAGWYPPFPLKKKILQNIFWTSFYINDFSHPPRKKFLWNNKSFFKEKIRHSKEPSLCLKNRKNLAKMDRIMHFSFYFRFLWCNILHFSQRRKDDDSKFPFC